MLVNLFEMLGVEKPTYLDIGAHHPTTISNTRLLYERGSRGVNVEANKNLVLLFDRERPEDVNVCAGVSPLGNGVAPFFMFDDFSGRNTFSKDEADRYASESGRTYTEKQLPVWALRDLVKNFCSTPPQLLCMDCEGLDFQLLQQAMTIPELSSLMVVCVEVRKHDTGRFEGLMDESFFGLYCRMGENLFFVRKDRFKDCF